METPVFANKGFGWIVEYNLKLTDYDFDLKV
jgi:hypothetical protein